jgi:hypothetical protein
LEVKQTTTISVTSDMKLKEVLEIVCKKRKVQVDDYKLKMPDTKTDVPLDKTIGQLQVNEFCLLKERGASGKIIPVI